jgi:hypothetical protein
MEWESNEGDKPKIYSWDQFVTTFHYCFEVYTQEGDFLAFKNTKQQGIVVC